MSSMMMILRSSTIADRRDLAHDVGFLSLLVADNHRSVQVLRIGMGTLGSAMSGAAIDRFSICRFFI